MKSYSIKSTVTLSVTFTDSVTELPIDPTTVLLRIYQPDGTETTYSTVNFTHPSTGLYQKNIVPDLTGIWRYRWQGIGTANVTFEKLFEVRPSVFIDVYRLNFDPAIFTTGVNGVLI